MMIPTGHNNGTGAESLLKALREAMGSLRKTIEDAGQVYPNGRDYYVQGPDAIGLAMAEHAARVERLRSVLSEWEAIARDVYKQKGTD